MNKKDIELEKLKMKIEVAQRKLDRIPYSYDNQYKIEGAQEELDRALLDFNTRCDKLYDNAEPTIKIKDVASKDMLNELRELKNLVNRATAQLNRLGEGVKNL